MYSTWSLSGISSLIFRFCLPRACFNFPNKVSVSFRILCNSKGVLLIFNSPASILDISIISFTKFSNCLELLSMISIYGFLVSVSRFCWCSNDAKPTMPLTGRCTELVTHVCQELVLVLVGNLGLLLCLF